MGRDVLRQVIRGLTSFDRFDAVVVVATAIITLAYLVMRGLQVR
jgi:hypothetical protein